MKCLTICISFHLFSKRGKMEKRIWIMKLLFRKSCSVSNLDFKTSFSKEKIVSIIIPMAELWRHNCKLIFYIISNRLTYYAFSFTELKKLKLVVGISATMCHSAEKIPAKEGCQSKRVNKKATKLLLQSI